jgi:hypothetical protein
MLKLLREYISQTGFAVRGNDPNRTTAKKRGASLFNFFFCLGLFKI